MCNTIVLLLHSTQVLFLTFLCKLYFKRLIIKHDKDGYVEHILQNIFDLYLVKLKIVCSAGRLHSKNSGGIDPTHVDPKNKRRSHDL